MTLLSTLNGTNSINILQNSANLLQNTVGEWNNLWDDIFTPTNQLWAALDEFALVLAGLGLLYTTFKKLDAILHEAHWSQLAGMFVMPIVIVLFLKGGGGLAANTVKVVRAIGFSQVSNMVQQQVAGQTFQVSIQAMQQNAAATNAIQQIYGPCNALPPADKQTCINDPAKVQQAQQVLTQLGVTPPANIGNLLTDPLGAFTGIIMVILYGVQWAFVNCIEAALIMTGLLFPISMGLSILPINPKPLYSWFVAMIALFSIQMSYNIVIGLVATVSFNASSAGGLLQSGQDIAFAIFLSVFSPVLSVALGSGGGLALFQQGQVALRKSVSGAVSAVNAATPMATKTATRAALLAVAMAGSSASQASPAGSNNSSSEPSNSPAPSLSNRALPQSRG